MDGYIVRKITSDRTVTTVAGMAGHQGSADGTGPTALLNPGGGMVCDSSGNIFFSDMNHTIRKITPAGVVTTFVGTAGTSGNLDGIGVSARFNNPRGLAIDSNDNIYVADYGNNLIRKVAANGQVSTYAGSGASSGIFTEGSKGSVTLGRPNSLAIDSNRNIFVFLGSVMSIVKILYSPN
jgi:sugar lactone lactonase YvrE